MVAYEYELIQGRIEEFRRAAARRRLAIEAAGRGPRSPGRVRAALGIGLVRFGLWLAGPAARPAQPARPAEAR